MTETRKPSDIVLITASDRLELRWSYQRPREVTLGIIGVPGDRGPVRLSLGHADDIRMFLEDLIVGGWLK